MAAEQTVIAVALFGLGFLWYSNECVKRGNLLWGQAFQVLAFLFVLADFPIMAQLMKAEGYFDMEDLLMQGLWQVVFYFMWVIVFFWIMSFIFSLLGTMRKPKFEQARNVGGNKFGPE